MCDDTLLQHDVVHDRVIKDTPKDLVRDLQSAIRRVEVVDYFWRELSGLNEKSPKRWGKAHA